MQAFLEISNNELGEHHVFCDFQDIVLADDH
jgi:hypothetical protein